MSEERERMEKVKVLETKIFALQDGDGKFSIAKAGELLKHLANEYVGFKSAEWDIYRVYMTENLKALPPTKRTPSRTPIHKIEISDKEFSTLTNGDIPDIIKNGLGELTYPDDAKFKVISKRKGKIRGRWEIRDKEGKPIYELHGRKDSIGVFKPNKK